MITKNCLECEKSFQTKKSEIKRGNGKFCSRKCSSKFNGRIKSIKLKKNRVPNVKCAQCEKVFYKSKSKIKAPKHGLHFCSRKCKDSAQKIGGIVEIQPDHYGTRTKILTADYRPKALEYYEKKCNRCGYDKYVEILHVHHKDRDRNNNSVENLEILCPNCHYEEHFLNKDGNFSYLI